MATEKEVRSLTMVRSIRAKLNFNRQITSQEVAFVRRHRDVFPVEKYPDDFLDRLTIGRVRSERTTGNRVMEEAIAQETKFWDSVQATIITPLLRLPRIIPPAKQIER